ILSLQTLESIWDIWIVGGIYGSTILSFMGLSLLINNKLEILENIKSVQDFQKFALKIKEKKHVRSTAISLWEKTSLEKMTSEQRQKLGL
ncbi:hypothetical protein HK096_008819, partial [Nowakowskiella sp. JEL0078]